jgi:hypothetical protein
LSSARTRLGLLLAAGLAILTASLVGVTQAEVAATQNTIIKFDSRISPRLLPRHGSAPVGITIEGRLRTRKGREASPLTALELGINKAAGVSRKGLPVCEIGRIDPASSAQALEACPGAQIGHGLIHAQSSFPGTKNFRFKARVTIFNGELEDGRPAVLLHVFNPVLRTSYVFPFSILHRRGRYGTVLSAHVRLGRWSSVKAFKLVLKRSYRFRGEQRSFLNASCPAPRDFGVGVSSFVLATLRFADGTESKIPVVGWCKVAR